MDRSGVGGSTGSTHQHAKSLPASPPPAPSVCLMMVIMIIMMLSAIERRYLIWILLDDVPAQGCREQETGLPVP